MNSLISTQASSNYIDYSTYKEKYSHNVVGDAFIREFCSGFSYSFRKDILCRDFYYIEEEKCRLKKLLLYDLYTSFSYEVDRVLETNMKDLLLHGKAYVEVVFWFDNRNELKKISFVPFWYKKQLCFNGDVYYKIRKFDGEIIQGRILKENIITFRLKDLGFSKRYFQRLLKKLGKIVMPSTDLIEDESVGFDFEEFKKRQDKKTLYLLDRIRWKGINNNNRYVSEPYLLYRNIKYQILRKEFMDYLLKGYNNKLQLLGRKYGFDGKIRYRSNLDKYESKWSDLRRGKINCEQLCDYIFH